jgi:CspA family cold shock protein
MATGRIKTFHDDRGFGFIDDGTGEDRFFHVTEVSGAQPKPGMKVTFKPITGDRGPRAELVQPVHKADMDASARSPKRPGSTTPNEGEGGRPSAGASDPNKVVCSGCGREVVPRLVHKDREPYKSHCPICGETIAFFASFWIESFFGLVVMIIIGVAIIGSLL